MEHINKEIWKDTTVSPYYEVSNLGRVRAKARLVPCNCGFRRKKEHLLTPIDNHGYYSVRFRVDNKLKGFLVHRLVMYAFGEIRKYPEWEIDHLNGDSHDNRFENLEYVTSSENTKRAYASGLQDRSVLSASNHLRKISPEQVIEMKNEFVRERRIFGHGHNNSDFILKYANLYNVKPTNIRDILSGRTNNFFNEDIVQTTKSVYHHMNIEDIPEQGNLNNSEYFKKLAKLLGVGWRGIETHFYHNHRTIPEIVQYYNDKNL